MRARVDSELCISCGLCADVCPEVFEIGDDDKARVKVDPVPPEAEASCREAAEQCPSTAIQIEES
jgi:ferredoxin